MPTNDERRNAAQRFRAIDYDALKESTICAFLDAIGENGYTDWVGIAHSIAKLIDPEVCHVVTTERRVSQTQTMVTKSCSCCGHVFGSEEHRPFLPGLDEEIVLDEVRIPNYCQNCGAKVVN